MPFRNRKTEKMLKINNRYELATKLIKSSFESVLDVGCRQKILKKYLPEGIKYQGIDLEEGDEIIKADLEKGIPFGEKSFDVVFCLEVLEHLDNIEFALKELIRVAKKEVIISLPNMFYWLFRIKFLFGSLTHHYDFYPRLDGRHKWLPSYYSSIEFIKKNTRDYKVDIGHYIYNHQTLKFMDIIDKLFSYIFPSLFVNSILFRIDVSKKNE